ncbi:MAG: hypothetical protein IKS92_01780 [Victivallales bacterium]|nr:hypothetical protein [Victivallales bacterium]MBR5026789.1 hypothetical protein [Victivallales bacterium]MBR5079228.1 hypothetical protein [Victivallales bacterium]
MTITTPTKNHTNWNTVQNEKYACMVVFPTLSFLCLAGLIVVLSYMFISINKQNRKLDADNAALLSEYDVLTYQLQNVDSELEQKGNVHLVANAPRLNLQKATTTQIYILDAPSPLEFVQEGDSQKEPSQVAEK